MEDKKLAMHKMRVALRLLLEDGFTMEGVRFYLQDQFVNIECGITVEEFEKVLNDEYSRLYGEEVWVEG